MQELTRWTTPDAEASLPELLREWWAAAARRRGLMLAAFFCVLAGAAAAIFLQPPTYVANSKILVKRERVDTLVTADSSSATPQLPGLVTEMEVNSEVELIRSRDLMLDVAKAGEMQKAPPGWSWQSLLHIPEEPRTEESALAAAVRELQSGLKVEALPKTTVISMSYQSRNPRRAAEVLNTLYSLYLRKHIAVHQPAGALDFFQGQRLEYQRGMAAVEARLMLLGGKGVVSPEQVKVTTLQKAVDLGAELKQGQAAIAQTERRIAALEAEEAGLPSRMTGPVRKSDNPQLLGQLKSTLLNLELKRTDMLRKFEPGYPLVQDAQTQILQTREAIAAAEKAQLREETTDRNPVFEWVGSELVKARAELAGLRARGEVMAHNSRAYAFEARDLDQKDILRQDLLRDFKTQESNYFLYLKKEEEARISEALNRSRIVNIALVEAAAVPTVPARSRALMLLIGLMAAIAVSVGAVVVAEYFNPPLRDRPGMYELLGLPVLASVSSLDLKALPRADSIGERHGK